MNSKEEKIDDPARNAAADDPAGNQGASSADSESQPSEQPNSAPDAPSSETPGPDSQPTIDPAALQSALAAEKDRNLRLFADFENFRRRMERERLETYRHAEEDILSAILPVLDNFDRAMAQAGDDPFSTGVKMVYSSLSDFLKKREVSPIEALGKSFNPAEHEAVAYQPSPDSEEGLVIYETRKGYRIGDRILRPASVIVSSGKPAE